MSSPFSVLNDDDREALLRSARDLSDIDKRTRDRIDAGFERAYATAKKIADGSLDPLTH